MIINEVPQPDHSRSKALAGLNRRYQIVDGAKPGQVDGAMPGQSAVDGRSPFPGVQGLPERAPVKHPVLRTEARLLAMLFLGVVLLGVVVGVA